jgi:hypothetical protein
MNQLTSTICDSTDDGIVNDFNWIQMKIRETEEKKDLTMMNGKTDKYDHHFTMTTVRMIIFQMRGL